MSLLKCYVHAVWAVKYRQRLLGPEMKTELIDSIHGLLKSRGHQPIITNFEPDHVHSLFRFSMREDIGSAMKALKGGSSQRQNEVFFKHNTATPFRWQGGYAVFSVCPTHVRSKAQYVRDQRIIHERRAFLDEYVQLRSEHPPLDLDESGGHNHYFDPLADV